MTDRPEHDPSRSVPEAPVPDNKVSSHWGRAYTAPDITVYYDRERCIHYAACVRGLPDVFDTSRKPWIQAANAPAEQMADVVRRCPTGALHFVSTHAPPEPAEPTTVDVRENGPYFLRGSLTVATPDGDLRDTRVALCRCGNSKNKPFCDGSHRDTGFQAAGGQKLNTF